MSHPDRGKTGLAAILALALLAGLLFANLMYVNGSTDHQLSAFEPETDGERVTIRAKVPAEPGDRVSLSWFPYGALSPVFDRVEFHAVEEGEGLMITNGSQAPHTYARASANLTPGTSLSQAPITFTRPAVNQSPVEDEFDFPGNWVDLVWVFHIAPGQSLPENETARQLFLRGLDVPDATDVAIVQASAVQAQPWFYTGEALLGVAAVGLGGLTLWPSRQTPRIDEEATDTEALIALVERGESYLANLRNLLVITGVLLFFLGMFGVVAIDDVFLLAIDPGAPGDTWEVWMERGFAFVWLSLVATWLILLVAVQRALMRWREHARDRPLDL